MEPLVKSSYNLKDLFTTRNLYLLGMCTVVCGLSWSNVVMSIGQFVMAGSWLISTNYREKLFRLYNNKFALLIIAFFLLHVLGLLWTEDLTYGLKDVRIKLSLFVITFIVASFKPLTTKEVKLIIHVFLATILLITFVSFTKLLGFTEDALLDKRNISIRISHIRYGLMIAFASYCCFYYTRNSESFKFLYLIVGLYFFSTLIWFELYTGLLIFIAVGIIYLIRNVFFESTVSRAVKSIAIIALLTIFVMPLSIIYKVYYDFNYPKITAKYDQDKLERYTLNGNQYLHETKENLKENGFYVYRYIAIDELVNEWHKRSDLPFKGFDKKGQVLRETIYRYLTSKGLKKDSVGIHQLSSADITAIENGTANVYYTNHSNIENRIFSTLYELESYHKYKKADGFSIAMRIEYWKTALKIIKENPIYGVGTGDIQNQFFHEYQKESSLLEKERYWRRSHNQYLSTWIQLGILGLIILIAIMFMPFFHLKGKDYILYFVFLQIIILSMLTEDTLETQAGITFYAIFNAIFLSNSKT